MWNYPDRKLPNTLLSAWQCLIGLTDRSYYMSYYYESLRSHFHLTLPSLYLIYISENTRTIRSEEHTSELQSRGHLVCRLLLEKKNAKSMGDMKRKGAE